MSQHQECTDYLKGIAKFSNIKNKSYCQKLTMYSKEFGFNNYHDFKNTLPKLSSDRLGKKHSELMHRYCQIALPSPKLNYLFSQS